MRCPDRTARFRPVARGVTLVEMIVVIAITGIIAAVVATFIRRPVEGYFDAARRAELADAADTALRRITRDVRLALPNSIRTTSAGGVEYIEFLQTSGGGRYRAEVDSGGAGDILNFTTADTTFDVIGNMPAFSGGESIVVYNLAGEETNPPCATGPATTSANAYSGDNRANYAGNTATTITLSAAKLFPLASPGKRFHVVQYPVTYACDVASGVLRRYWNYPISQCQATPPATANDVLLAQNVSACSFTYTTSASAARTGVLSLTLQLTRDGESARLFQQVHVSNVP